MENQKIKAIAYGRVSTAEQENEGFSIPAQLDLLNEYAEKNNIELVKIFTEAETAKDVGRHQFKEMLKFLKANNDVNMVIAEKTDRLYRNFYDYIDLDVDKTGYSVCLVKEGTILTQDSSSHEKFMHGLKVLLAKNFIDNLREETQKGRKKKVETGFFIGQVPYGYQKINKNDSILHPQKSKFVKRAFEIYAQGNISLKNTVQQLYNEGFIYTPSHAKISSGQLEKILKNDSYIGYIRYAGQLYKGKHPQIVSKKLFMKVQLASFCIGWGLQYVAMFDKDGEGERNAEVIQNNLKELASIIFICDDNNCAIEDLFTTEDFNKFILSQIKEKIDDKSITNTKFIKEQKLDKVLLAKMFYDNVKKFKKSNFEETTLNNFNNIFKNVFAKLNIKLKESK